MKVLLFDMDGVLLEPRGYHRALQETVAQVGGVLGYQEIDFGPQEIAVFEAAGVISEWDSSAISAALLLERLWDRHPALTLPATLSSPACPEHDVPSPDFQAFARSLAQSPGGELPPLTRAERQFLSLKEKRTDAQKKALKNVLRNARHIDRSLTHRTFEELVLGSGVFAETFGLSSSLGAESYLLLYDRSNLGERDRAALLNWLQVAGHRAAIFTARPSRPPEPTHPPSAPEAEIGVRGVGLEMLPIAGLGGLLWLADQRGCDAQALVKPAPVHTLAALRAALGESLKASLEAAAALALDGQVDDVWRALRGAEVYVLEDTTPGLKSIQATAGLLAEIGVPIQVHLFGITDRAAKREALEAAGVTVVPALADALEQVPGFRVSF